MLLPKLLLIPAAVALLLGTPALGQQAGTITDTVRCRAQPEQSYALYLPQGYVPSRRWPVLFLFDPAAQGSVPVRRYQAAADSLGFVLAASNTSRNGPLAASLASAEAMLTDAQSRFSLDGHRLYTAGFSGGSRVASAVAMLAAPGTVAGTVGCGAGLPDLPGSTSLPAGWVHAGLVGLDDFNYPEMLDLQREFDQAQIPHVLLSFNGDHAWPPAFLMQQALAWLTLQAMKVGTCPPQPLWLNRHYQQALRAARQAEAAAQLPLAAQLYTRLTTDFAGLLDVSLAQAAASRLAASPVVRQAAEQQHTLHQRELALQQQAGQAYRAALAAASAGPHSLDAPWWQQLAAQLHTLQHSPDSAEHHLGVRALHSLEGFLASKGYGALADKDYPTALTAFRLWTFIEPEQPASYLPLASAYAAAGQPVAALKALEEAVDKGLTDRQQLESNPAFAKLRPQKRFQQLIARLPGSPASSVK